MTCSLDSSFVNLIKWKTDYLRSDLAEVVFAYIAFKYCILTCLLMF